MFNVDFIKKNIFKNFVLNKIIYFKKINSTNKFLKENNFSNGTVVLAEQQTAGYGKLGAKWMSPKGGLWFSFVLNKKIKVPYKYLMAAAVAIVKTLKKYKINAKIKKPNDVLINDKKVCGVLIENDYYCGKLIVGVGLNVNNTLPEKTHIPVISLKKVLKRKVDLNKLFVELLEIIDKHLKKDIRVIKKEWNNYLADW
jgi:BirA family biotin operon repressor/biotin-[acetyl-CoA-carboxylase] ligase